MVCPGRCTMVRVMLLNTFNNRSVVGLSMPFLGLFSIRPVNFSWLFLSFRRTTNSIRVSRPHFGINQLFFFPLIVCDLLRNRCAIYSGITVRFAPELLCDLTRILQFTLLLLAGNCIVVKSMFMKKIQIQILNT